MSQQAQALTKAGWTHVRTTKSGMVKQVWWREPARLDGRIGTVQPQAYAYAWMRQDKKTKAVYKIDNRGEAVASTDTPNVQSASSTLAAPAKGA